MRRSAIKAGVALLSVAAWLGLSSSPAPAGARAAGCSGWGRPALAADPHPHALRVFAIQFEQRPAQIRTAADYAHAIDCAIRIEVLPHLARGRPNVVVFDEDIGLETLAIGPRGAAARALLRHGVPACHGQALCPTLATLTALDTGYGAALTYLGRRFPSLGSELGRSFVAATDEFARVFMTTMATEARRYGVYVIASNTQAPFRVTSAAAAISALSDPGASRPRIVYEPTAGVAYDQTFVWGPTVVHRGRPAPLANLIADNYKLPLTSFEQALGFAPGPSRGPAARANLRPISIPGTGARLGIATSLPAFQYGPGSGGRPCADVAVTYMRCLDALGANVVIQADANEALWTGVAGNEQWQPLAWMGSAYRSVTDASVHFTYAVNPFMVGNLADLAFDGQSAILERGQRRPRCNYIGNRKFVPGQDLARYRRYAGPKPQFLALAPWVASGSRAHLRRVGAALAAGAGGSRYVQTALIADLPFPADRGRQGCAEAGR